MSKNNKKYSLVLFRRGEIEVNNINNKRFINNKDISVKLRKNKLNILNSKDSNLPSTTLDSKLKEKTIDNKKYDCKTTNNREYQKKEKIILKGKKIQKINIENDNNIKFLKKNLEKINTEEDLIENKITDIKIIKNTKNDLISKNMNKNKLYSNLTLERPRIHLYKKRKIQSHNFTSPNSKPNISSFDKRKSYKVPIIKNKKSKKTKEIKEEKKKSIELDKNVLEMKEMLTSNLIRRINKLNI